jgi:hypothetical protein
LGAFQFVVLAKLRAAQLIRGCIPKIKGTHKATITAQVEVAQGKVMQVFAAPAVLGEPRDDISVPPLEDAPVLVGRT